MALKLGYASPARMLREMRPSELGMWRALYVVDPWGEERADLRQAMTTQAVSQGLLKKESGEAFSVRDFMPTAVPTSNMTMAHRLRAFLVGRPKKG